MKKKNRKFTELKKKQIVKFAERHGKSETCKQFGVTYGQLTSWLLNISKLEVPHRESETEIIERVIAEGPEAVEESDEDDNRDPPGFIEGLQERQRAEYLSKERFYLREILRLKNACKKLTDELGWTDIPVIS